MKKAFAFAIAFTLFSHYTNGNTLPKIYFHKFIYPFKTIVERGLEIRYYVYNENAENLPSEIIVDETKYPLYISKEAAIESIRNASIKKDYTIVYVVSSETKNTEIISIID